MACLAQPVGNAGGYSYLYVVDAQSLIRRRNEYGKSIRKEYENGNPNNIRMKDIRDWTTKTDGIANTLTTVGLDRMIMVEVSDE